MTKDKMNFEEVYKSYKLSSNTVKIIGETKYFKIINKDTIHEFGIIAIPNEVFNISGNLLKDDKGKEFKVGNPITYSFNGMIPQWYLETVQVLLEDIGVDEIGEYVTLIG